MIWIPVFAILGIVVAAKYALDESESLPGVIIRGIIATPICSAAGSLVGVVVACVVGIFSLLLPANETIISETPIYSLVDESGTYGRFVLGTGTVDSDLHIYYITETEDGSGKEIEKVKRDNAVIVENDAVQPNEKVVGKRLKWKWAELFVLDENVFFDKTILTVPVGTTTTEYIVDLK